MAYNKLRPSILLVDDVHANLVALKRLLQDFEVDLIMASSGLEALQKSIEVSNLSLILLDVQMPEMDGYETANFLREEEQTSHIPIIFLTAVHRDEVYAVKGYEAGAVDYITKPINPAILKSKVQIFIQLWQLRAELEIEVELRRESEAYIIKLAHRDALTNLPNRRALPIIFEKEINRAERLKKNFFVLMLDLDKFKEINDGLGHEAGDKALTTVAERLKFLKRNYDSAVRIGGDEFVVLLYDVDNTQYLKVILERFIQEITRPFQFNAKEIEVGVSIGAACFPHNGKEMDQLMRKADSAMYQSKNMGGNQLVIYNEDTTKDQT